MRKSRIRALPGLALLSGLILLLAGIFIPRSYPQNTWKSLPATQYLIRPDGSRIAWQLLKPGSLEREVPVIFLQGGPGGFISAHTLEMLRPIAGVGFNVYAYDQIGAGSSSRLENIRDYTVERHIADLDALVRETGGQRVILIGQSWGGILASLYAAAHPERVAGIVFTCPGPLPAMAPEQNDLRAPDSLQLRSPMYSNRQANKESSNLRTRVSAWIARRFGRRLMPDAEADAFQSMLNRRLAKSTYCDASRLLPAPASGSGYYVQLMTMLSLSRSPDPRPALRTPRIPVLILKGQCDNQPWGVTQEYQSVFRNSRLEIIAGAGHNIFAEQPEAYHRAILRFLLDEV